MTRFPLLAPALLTLPGLALAGIGAPLAVGRPLGERANARLATGAFGLAFLAAAAGALLLALGRAHAGVWSPGAWFSGAGYAYGFALSLDPLSAGFSAVVALLVTLIAAFSGRYLHKEPGFTRFYLLLCLFGTGALLVTLSGTLDALVAGWEAVGLASALLIAFFTHRRAPVRHGLRAFATYRVADVGLLGAALWLHWAGRGTGFVAGGAPWPALQPPAGALACALGAGLLLLAAMGKSALFPLGGWLPRAMEGPTPSSAIFYGAVSVSLGPFLLLRAAPLLAASPAASAAVALVGAATALFATFVERAQTDIKSALAYASMTQIGLVVLEIGLGLLPLAVVHLIGHAFWRTGQLLRSPSVIHDHHVLEQEHGALLPRHGRHLERLVPGPLQVRLYRLALERGDLDGRIEALLDGLFGLLGRLDGLERAWLAWLAREPGRPAARGRGARPATEARG